MSLIISPPPVSTAGLQFGTIARVQSTTANTANASAASATLTFGAPLTVGNLLVIAFASNATQPCKGVDSLTGQTAGSASIGTNTSTAGLSFFIIQVADTTVVCSLTNTAGSANMGFVGAEYSGAKFRSDGPLTPAIGTSGTNTTASVTAEFGNELIVAAMGTRGTFGAEQTGWLTLPTNNFNSVGQTSSFTNVANTDRAVALLERIVTSPGSYSTAGTQASANWANMIATFASD